MTFATEDDVKVTLVDAMGDDARIVATARQSTDGAFRGWGTEESPGDERLLRWMMMHKHDSVFEFGTLHVHIDAPLFVARQVMRHRTFSFSEMSGRYVEMKNEAYRPDAWYGQSKTNKQGSSDPLHDAAQDEAYEVYDEQIESAYRAYRRLLAIGVCKEQARYVIPLSEMTHWDMCGDLRAWLGFILLRKPENVQHETRVICAQVEKLVAERWPRTHKYFTELRCG